MEDTYVIGGGLIGMLTARELVISGERVTLLERGVLGQESSWAGGGILSPLHPWRYPEPVSALARWSQGYYQGLARDLTANTGIDPEWTQSGLLWLGAEEKAAARAWADSHKSLLEVLDARGIRTCEPAVGVAPDEGLWMPEVAQVRNPRMLQALRAEIGRLGVAVKEGVGVEGFRHRNGVLEGLTTNHGNVAVSRALVAGGAWTGQLLEATGLSLPVKPIRGQMLLFKGPPGMLRRMVMKGDRYVIPRRDGRILVGSTLEDVGFEKMTTQWALEDLRAAAIDIIPGLAELPVEKHWAGLRPGSPTGVPYIGEHPRIQGLFINAGHFRNGVVLGLASARLVADLMLGRPPVLDPAPYHLNG